MPPPPFSYQGRLSLCQVLGKNIMQMYILKYKKNNNPQIHFKCLTRVFSRTMKWVIGAAHAEPQETACRFFLSFFFKYSSVFLFFLSHPMRAIDELPHRCYAQLSFHQNKRVMFFSPTLGGLGDFFSSCEVRTVNDFLALILLGSSKKWNESLFKLSNTAGFTLAPVHEVAVILRGHVSPCESFGDVP